MIKSRNNGNRRVISQLERVRLVVEMWGVEVGSVGSRW